MIFLSQSSRILLAAVCGFRPIKLMSTFVKTPPPSQLYLASTNYHEWDKQKFKFVDFSLKGYIVPTRKARTEIPDFVIFSWVGIHQKIPRQAPLSQSSHSGQPSLAQRQQAGQPRCGTSSASDWSVQPLLSSDSLVHGGGWAKLFRYKAEQEIGSQAIS